MSDDRVKQLEILLTEELQGVAKYLKERLPKEWGFMVFLFEQNVDHGACLYVSDSDRDDVIESMKKFIEVNEAKKNANDSGKSEKSH